ncbi:hypothetical protein [Flavobacterium sp.]|uniref:hypothetical protein n=1 Tax=Flavobacterium sp. TaxID=239 RepID=UPI00286DF480|nr:hypothetical protein [Flavobacterium sp.]
MIKNQINKIILFLLLLFLINCGSRKIDINDEYRSYQIAKGLDPSVKKSFKYFEDFLNHKDSVKRQALLNSNIIKVNKVYMYKRNSESYTFCVFSDDGYAYNVTTTMYKNQDTQGYIVGLKEYVDASQNNIIKFNTPINLNYLGSFELKNNTISIKRSEKTPFREWNENDVGVFKNDTLTMTATYISKKREYKKKWLAKTHKTNFIFVYQPDLKAIGYKNKYGNGIAIEGSFNVK